MCLLMFDVIVVYCCMMCEFYVFACLIVCCFMFVIVLLAYRSSVLYVIGIVLGRLLFCCVFALYVF